MKNFFHFFFQTISVGFPAMFCLFVLPAIAQKTYYDAGTGITISAPNYHSITPNNGIFIIVRTDQYASQAGVSIVWPFKQAPAEELKNSLLAPVHFDGFQMSAVSSMETLNGSQWGGYASGVVQGNAVYGYTTAISDPVSGRGAVWMHFYTDPSSKKIAREAAIERAQLLMFDPPATAVGRSPTPEASPSSKAGGKVVEVEKVCTACAGVGSSLCYSCQGVGSKTSTGYRYTTQGMVMETSKTSCTLCSGTGRIKCHVCSGAGRKKDWEYRKEAAEPHQQPVFSAENTGTTAPSPQTRSNNTPVEKKLVGTWETVFREDNISYKMEYNFRVDKKYVAKMWQVGVAGQPVVWTGIWSLGEDNSYVQSFDEDNSFAYANIKWKDNDDFVLTITKHPIANSIGKSLTYKRINSLNRR